MNWKKNITTFLTCQAISILGSMLVQYAIFWHITIKMQSGFYMTLYIIFAILPSFFMSPVGGVWADKYNRKYLIILADATIALATLILAILFIAGYEHIWLIFIVAGIRALGSAIQTPAVNAMIPDIVPKEKLTRINGINSSVQSAISLISPMISGVIINFISIKMVFFIDVITATIAIAILFLFFNLPKRQTKLSTESFYAQIRAGAGYIAENKEIKVIFIFFAILAFTWAAPAFLSPLQVTRSYSNDLWRLTALETLFATGMLIGGIIISTWGGFKDRIKTFVFACVITGFCCFIIGFSIPFWSYLTIITIWGITLPLANTSLTVFLQENTNELYMGRVFGILMMINSGMMPAGMLLYGPLADRIPIEQLMLLSGIVILIVAITLWLSVIKIRKSNFR